MDYRLRRQPDGSVNAMPGDAVEVWDGAQWLTGYTYTDLSHGVCVFTKDSIRHDYASPNFVRHAPGGSGWHRLREARLRSVVEAAMLNISAFRSDLPTAGEQAKFMVRVIGDQLAAALADLDNAEPEA